MYLIEMMGGGIVPKISKLLTGIIYRANQFENVSLVVHIYLKSKLKR